MIAMPLIAHEGAIATPHSAASEAGAAALRAGGTAIDAALAAAATLCVVYPNNVALGSDLVALVRSPDGAIRFVNATGWAGENQTLEKMRHRHGDAMPERGVDAITLPGAVRGWEALHSMGARLSWKAALEPAIRWASSGIPTARSVASALAREPGVGDDPGFAATFHPGGRPLREGELLVQPRLAETLRRLSDAGAQDFYEGDLAEKWLTGLARAGSLLRPEDAAAFAPEVLDPLELDFGRYRVRTSPPNTQGFVLLRALAHAQRLIDPMGADVGDLVRSIYASNGVRADMLGDPRFGSPSGEELMSAGALGEHQSRRASGDTVGISAVSADGFAVSLVQSVYFGFGSGVVEQSTGILFQNRGTSFSLVEGNPSSIAPRKRPPHTLMPVMVTEGDELRWVSSTMGGQAQPQVHTQLLLRSFAGASPSEAVDAPRWAVGAQGHGDGARTLTVESDVPGDIQEALAAEAGLAVKLVPPRSEALGHAALIRVNSDGSCDAASDPRSDGSSIVVSAAS